MRPKDFLILFAIFAINIASLVESFNNDPRMGLSNPGYSTRLNFKLSRKQNLPDSIENDNSYTTNSNNKHHDLSLVQIIGKLKELNCHYPVSNDEFEECEEKMRNILIKDNSHFKKTLSNTMLEMYQTLYSMLDSREEEINEFISIDSGNLKENINQFKASVIASQNYSNYDFSKEEFLKEIDQTIGHFELVMDSFKSKIGKLINIEKKLIKNLTSKTPAIKYFNEISENIDIQNYFKLIRDTRNLGLFFIYCTKQQDIFHNLAKSKIENYTSSVNNLIQTQDDNFFVLFNKYNKKLTDGSSDKHQFKKNLDDLVEFMNIRLEDVEDEFNEYIKNETIVFKNAINDIFENFITLVDKPEELKAFLESSKNSYEKNNNKKNVKVKSLEDYKNLNLGPSSILTTLAKKSHSNNLDQQNLNEKYGNTRTTKKATSKAKKSKKNERYDDDDEDDDTTVLNHKKHPHFISDLDFDKIDRDIEKKSENNKMTDVMEDLYETEFSSEIYNPKDKLISDRDDNEFYLNMDKVRLLIGRKFSEIRLAIASTDSKEKKYINNLLKNFESTLFYGLIPDFKKSMEEKLKELTNDKNDTISVFDSIANFALSTIQFHSSVSSAYGKYVDTIDNEVDNLLYKAENDLFKKLQDFDKINNKNLKFSTYVVELEKIIFIVKESLSYLETSLREQSEKIESKLEELVQDQSKKLYTKLESIQRNIIDLKLELCEKLKNKHFNQLKLINEFLLFDYSINEEILMLIKKIKIATATRNFNNEAEIFKSEVKLQQFLKNHKKELDLKTFSNIFTLSLNKSKKNSDVKFDASYRTDFLKYL